MNPMTAATTSRQGEFQQRMGEWDLFVMPWIKAHPGQSLPSVEEIQEYNESLKGDHC
jgi:hypothetical protein